MELWCTEKQTDNLSLSFRLKETLRREKTSYQDLAVVETLQYGRMLLLDGCVMTSEADEFVYHEMITHVPLFTHPYPRRALVIGGGDGGAIREILKHPSVEEAVLVEIDARVIEASKQFLPAISSALADPRCRVVVEDGIKHVKTARGRYDVIISDSTDPIGPAVGLFTEEFYRNVREALTEDGVFAAQTESPFLHARLIADVQRRIGAAFPITRLYLAAIPTYPSGLWSFTLGSKRHDPLQPRPCELETRYYTSALHRGAFQLPRFVEALAVAGEANGRPVGEAEAPRGGSGG